MRYRGTRSSRRRGNGRPHGLHDRHARQGHRRRGFGRVVGGISGEAVHVFEHGARLEHLPVLEHLREHLAEGRDGSELRTADHHDVACDAELDIEHPNGGRVLEIPGALALDEDRDGLLLGVDPEEHGLAEHVLTCRKGEGEVVRLIRIAAHDEVQSALRCELGVEEVHDRALATVPPEPHVPRHEPGVSPVVLPEDDPRHLRRNHLLHPLREGLELLVPHREQRHEAELLGAKLDEVLHDGAHRVDRAESGLNDPLTLGDVTREGVEQPSHERAGDAEQGDDAEAPGQDGCEHQGDEDHAREDQRDHLGALAPRRSGTELIALIRCLDGIAERNLNDGLSARVVGERDRRLGLGSLRRGRTRGRGLKGLHRVVEQRGGGGGRIISRFGRGGGGGVSRHRLIRRRHRAVEAGRLTGEVGGGGRGERRGFHRH